MPQEIFPEILAATEALEKRIALTEKEITEMKDVIGGKKQLVRALRKAVSAITPQTAPRKKRGAAN
jgi:uncharacterized coiled-coil protein SlyX